MSSASKIVLIIFLICLSAQLSHAGNDKNDAWFGKDKFEHFTVSAFYSGGAAIVADKHFDMSRNDSIVLGIGITISLGAGKEVYDYSRPDETSSLKDFVWDIGGALMGGLIASLIL